MADDGVSVKSIKCHKCAKKFMARPAAMWCKSCIKRYQPKEMKRPVKPHKSYYVE